MDSDRFYVRQCEDEAGNYNVYDRQMPHPINSTGHWCVRPCLTHDEATELADKLNKIDKKYNSGPRPSVEEAVGCK